jgi:hypothetical protein
VKAEPRKASSEVALVKEAAKPAPTKRTETTALAEDGKEDDGYLAKRKYVMDINIDVLTDLTLCKAQGNLGCAPLSSSRSADRSPNRRTHYHP